MDDFICFICGDSTIQFIEMDNEIIDIDDFNFDNEPGKCFCQDCYSDVNHCCVCGTVSDEFEFAEIDDTIHKFGKLDIDIKPNKLFCNVICVKYYKDTLAC